MTSEAEDARKRPTPATRRDRAPHVGTPRGLAWLRALRQFGPKRTVECRPGAEQRPDRARWRVSFCEPLPRPLRPSPRREADARTRLADHVHSATHEARDPAEPPRISLRTLGRVGGVETPTLPRQRLLARSRRWPRSAWQSFRGSLQVSWRADCLADSTPMSQGLRASRREPGLLGRVLSMRLAGEAAQAP